MFECIGFTNVLPMVQEIDMPNKETPRVTPAPASTVGCSPAGTASKPVIKTEPMSPPPQPPCSPPAAPAAPAPACAAAELLGSLTTQQQQRTSARVIKKLRLDSAPDDPDKRDAECVLDKLDGDKEGEGKSRQRMPKALWSGDEKTLFFEALNEYGKDFDAITAYIRAKMKRKGSSGKNKVQVAHFYYRTWHKLAKHTDFGENVKKVAQELYALINYGEMRRKMAGGVNDRTCARLRELIARGTVLMRVRGRNVRLRTPQCRALRKLNRITECSAGVRVPTRVTVWLRARDASAWARVQSAAHNPRVALAAPLRVHLADMLRALAKRWDAQDLDHSEYGLSLHVGPRAGLPLHAPTLATAPSIAHKICFDSYLERMGHAQCGPQAAKIRTPKRQRKDSGTERDGERRARETDDKCGLDIDDTAVDGIELMATLSHDRDCKREMDQKADNFDTDTDEVRDEGMDVGEVCEKDSFSDEEGCYDPDEPRSPARPQQKFRNLKVKFRVRAKRTSESTLVYSVVKDSPEHEKADDMIDIEAEEAEREEENKMEASDEKNIAELNVKNEGGKGTDIEELKESSEHKGECGTKADEDRKLDEERRLEEERRMEDEVKALDEKEKERLERARKQMARGWSMSDAGRLTLGDLYLMFGCESRLELDYWWASPSSPLSPTPAVLSERTLANEHSRVHASEHPRMQDREDGSDSELMSPRQHYCHDSNDALSGDEQRKRGAEEGAPVLRLADKLVNRPESPPRDRTHLNTITSRLRRLLALAAGGTMLGGAVGGAVRSGGAGGCVCGHVCPQKKRPTCSQEAFRQPSGSSLAPKLQTTAPNEQLCLDDLPKWRRGRPPVTARPERVVVQRTILPLMPKPAHTVSAPLVSMVESNPVPTTPVAILPRPSAITTVATIPTSVVYVLTTDTVSETRSDRVDAAPQSTEEVSVTVEAPTAPELPAPNVTEPITSKVFDDEQISRHDLPLPVVEGKPDSRDQFSGFLSQESLSIPCLSPSRLLRDSDGTWLERDFSLSSFLGHLEGAAPPPAAEVDTQLQCMMQESSIDYMAKFADLAAEVASDRDK